MHFVFPVICIFAIELFRQINESELKSSTILVHPLDSMHSTIKYYYGTQPELLSLSTEAEYNKDLAELNNFLKTYFEDYKGKYVIMNPAPGNANKTRQTNDINGKDSLEYRYELLPNI